MIIRKARSDNKHAVDRAAERYNVELDGVLKSYLLSKIRGHKKSRLIKRQDGGRYVYEVTRGKKTYVIVVNEQRDTIVTFLPPSCKEASQ